MADAAKGRRTVSFLCGTPLDKCKGRPNLDHGKIHGSYAEVQNCQRSHLLDLGYTALSARTFQPPPDPLTDEERPVLVVNKKPQRAKPGKTEKGYMSQRLKIRHALPAALPPVPRCPNAKCGVPFARKSWDLSMCLECGKHFVKEAQVAA